MSARLLKREDLVYPELSYRIIGVLFDVYNKLGAGLSEIAYQRAVAVALKNARLNFKEQVYSPLTYEGVTVAGNFFDFLIEGRVVLELKKGNRVSRTHIQQVYQYLVSKKLKLGILAYFAPGSLHFKRIINL